VSSDQEDRQEGKQNHNNMLLDQNLLTDENHETSRQDDVYHVQQ
jgi:hypothetical protein